MTSEKENIVQRVCSICHDDIDYFAYGACNHPTCTKCILKLRKFGSADEPDFSKCPTCRRNLNKIVIVESFTPFDDLNTSLMRYDAQYDFLFESQKIGEYYHNMLKSYCPICGEEKRSLSALNRHTTSEHQLLYCDLCIRYSRLLPCEFVPMKPADLSEHRKWDKKRKKGHPLCNFCEERFYEMEDLVSHIRDNHFLCDLCMTTGKFVVFREQQELLQHYNDAHYLCPECRGQQRISCYSTADRLGLHRFQEHPNEVANDPKSWLPVSIQLAPGQEGMAANRRRDAPGDFSVGGILNTSDGRFIAETVDSGVRFRRANPAEWTGDDFPSLAPGSQPSDGSGSGAGSGVAGSTSRITSRDSTTALASYTNAVGDTSATQQRGGDTATVGTVRPSLAVLAGRGKQNRLTADDFPSLPGSSNSKSAAAPTWHAGNRTNREVPRTQPTQSREVPPNPGDFPELSPAAGHLHSNCQGTLATLVGHSVGQSGGGHQPAGRKPVKLQPPAADDFPSLVARGGHRGARTRAVGGSGPPTGEGSHRLLQQPGVRPGPGSVMGQTSNSTEAGGRGKQASRGRGRPQWGSNRRFEADADDDDEPNGPNQDYAILPEDRGEVFERSPQYTHIRTVDQLPSFGDTDKQEEEARENGAELDMTGDFPSLVNSTSTKRKKQPLGSQGQPKQASAVKSTAGRKSSKGHQAPVAAAVSLPADTECILFAETAYTPPPEMAARNRKLIESVENILFDVAGKTSFARFADLSRRYSHKQLTATAYMEGLLGLVAGDHSSRGSDTAATTAPAPLWIAPMLALLPDVGLQRALYRVLQGQGPPRLPQPDGSHRRTHVREPIVALPGWTKEVLALLKCCPQCGQVCLRTDMDAHSRDAHPAPES